MWPQWFNRNFTKLREYFLCAKKTKITTLFNYFFSFMSVLYTRSWQYHNACVCILLLVNNAQRMRVLHQQNHTNESRMAAVTNRKRRNWWIKLLFLFSLHTKGILVTSYHYGWTTDVTWTISMMSLLPFWALNMSVPLLSMKGQKALWFLQEYLNLCSEDERRS